MTFAPNYTQIPNNFFDYWMSVLSPAEFKVLMCISRKTFGWSKRYDAIPIKQIEKLTGLSRQGIIKNIESLIQHGLITKIKSKTDDGDDAINRYEINVNTVEGGGKLNSLGVVNSVDQGVVNSVDPQKKDYTKETITKEKRERAPPTKISSEEKLSFGEEGAVKLTQTQYDDLLKKMTALERDDLIESVEIEIGKIGESAFKKKSKSHYHTILSWHRHRKSTPRAFAGSRSAFQKSEIDRRTKDQNGVPIEAKHLENIFNV